MNSLVDILACHQILSFSASNPGQPIRLDSCLRISKVSLHMDAGGFLDFGRYLY